MCLLFGQKFVLLICTVFLTQCLWSFYDIYHRWGIWDAEMKKKEPRLSSPIGYIAVREEFRS